MASIFATFNIMIHSNDIFEMLSIITVQIKYYKVIREICKACQGAPTMFQSDFPRFWNVYSPKSSKAVFWDVLCINLKKQLE